jgi:multidrug efflux system outer membrane protein
MIERIRITDDHMQKRLFAAATMPILLSGCMVGPDYLKPPLATPGEFRASPTPAPDATSIADLKWSEVFSDEELQELVRTAIAQNYDLRVAVARVDAARANLGITRADQYPNIGVGAQYTNFVQVRAGGVQTDRQRIPSST